MFIVTLFFLLFAHADDPVYHIVLKNKAMSPTEIHVKAGEDFWLEVENNDNTSEEIESRSMKFEKIVPPKRTVKLKVGRLNPGTYDIFGDFHSDTCKGTVIADGAGK